eukprot:EC787454.1.p1 GENE.EC787454.1~~EC787454.1.p1  ORF type:complete len:95 (+),score=27.09 EC787454.1:17-301(+)
MSWRGRLSQGLQELRFVACGEGAGSKGVRDFVRKNYSELRLLNPGMGLRVREAAGASPQVVATFKSGDERAVSLANLSDAEVGGVIKGFADGKE